MVCRNDVRKKATSTLARTIIIRNEDLSYDGLSGFRERILSIIESCDEDIEMNFSSISLSLDSAAIGELMKFHTTLEKKDLKLVLTGVNKLIRTVFRLNKLDTILHIED